MQILTFKNMEINLKYPAKIAAKNHKNSVNNPLAQMQKDVGFDFCNNVSDRNPLVAPPLRLTDCSLISDGAAALVMVSDDLENNFEKSVKFRSPFRSMISYLCLGGKF